jgi:cytochrome c oxidase cbb3-type subunit 4
MDVDINTLRALSTLLVFVAFIGVVFWAYSSKRKQAFDEAANLPFLDDDMPAQSADSSALKGDTK